MFARFRFNDLKEPPAFAADADPMEIEWSDGLVWRCAGAVRRSIADDTVRSAAGYSKAILRGESLRKAEEEIGSAIRRRVANRGEARRVLLLWKVVSCGSGEHRWRTKLYLGRGEPFDDHHRSSTLGAEPKITGVPGA